ncbi:nucleotidyltransferase domain-containing protein [Motilimonas eburnea]|uniref:nucleotidyltransferase domain-containing protein n=1 Tax=Motilimonas eburnea TaxID=1737488 RepID=UPI001E4D7AA6|nr:nucleotidyltransferase domain-containing protein [Motilimonas eburnea]MCE2572294.1 nucleotidyltransferase domain-containing protein [Motilimonas eburnea]
MDTKRVVSADVIKPSVKAEIMRRIAKAEQEHDVKVLFAVESGSRAWGFASPNSDYDVRFIYAHRQEWYLTLDLESKRDVIEYPIVDEIDINGWDVRKALKLLCKSNPSFIEWLHSPIVYVDDGVFAKQVRELLPQVVSSQKGIYHYLHMAQGNYRGYLKQARVPLKKYFYVLRPLLAIMWLERYQQPAPIEFDVLRQLISNNSALDEAISDLVAKKRQSAEKEYGTSIPIINQFIEAELARNLAPVSRHRDPEASFAQLNALFQCTICHPAEKVVA